MILFGILGAYFTTPVIAGLLDPKPFGEIGLFIVMLVIFAVPAALFLFFFACALVSHLNYTKSKQYKRLKAFASGSVEELNMQVSRELSTSLVYANKRLQLTENWVCMQMHFSIYIRPNEMLIWAYKHITKTNYGVTLYGINLSFTDQKQFHVRLINEAQCDQLLAFIAHRYPYALLGYSKPLYHAYKNSFGEFMNTVRQNAPRQ